LSKHLDRIAAADRERLAAITTAEQAIRDAHAAGHTPSEIADALGVKNRSRVYSILGKSGFTVPEGAPTMRPMVYLVTRKRPDSIHNQVQEAMWARGWVVVSDHMSAWHLARGGAPMVRVDMSAHLGDTGTSRGGHQEVQIGQVKARYTPGEELADRELTWTTLDTYAEPRDGDDVDAARIARWVAEHMPTPNS
jgi:hypothetical protein